MSLRTKGLIIAAVHIALVCSLGAKLLFDRQTRPRVWVEVMPYDPDPAIRGRYVRLQAKAAARGFPDAGEPTEGGTALLTVEDDRLIATRSDSTEGEQVRIQVEDEMPVALLVTPLAYFIPEHVEDPTRLPGLMVEVTIPRRGPPRPIRLGVREDGRITPLDI